MRQASHQSEPFEPEFLLDWSRSQVGRRRTRESILGTTLFHVAVLLWLLSLPPGAPYVGEEELLARSYDGVPLVAPPPPVTDPEPIRSPSVAETSGARLNIPIPAPIPPPPPEPEPDPIIPEPPPPAALSSEPEHGREPAQPEVPAPPDPAPPPPATEPEKPEIAFEKPGEVDLSGAGVSSGVAAAPRIQIPSSSLEAAIRQLAREGTGKGTVIGDVELPSTDDWVVEARGAPPSPGRTGSNLTLLSDTKGVDFRPYLMQILATVRRNWYVVMPASARLGRRGRVLIQLAIDKDGNIPKLVIASSSGAEALDRAAVAGITASEPFPPLPEEFTGDEVRVQFSFLYTTKRRR